MKKQVEEAFLVVNGTYIKVRKIPKTRKQTIVNNNIIYLFPQQQKKTN